MLADQPIVMVNAVYAGPQAEGQKLLQPLFDLKPTRTNLTMIPWTKINAYAFFNSGAPFNKSSCSKNATRNIYGGAVKHFNIPTFDNFYSNYDKLIESMPEQLDGSRYFVEFVSNQAVQAVPVDATSYPWRDITAHL